MKVGDKILITGVHPYYEYLKKELTGTIAIIVEIDEGTDRFTPEFPFRAFINKGTLWCKGVLATPLIQELS